MSNKSLLVLASITLVIIIAAAISSRDRAPQTTLEKPPLTEGLESRINDVNQIVIESKDKAVHIIKSGDEWVIMQADNYPARFEKVKKLVLDVADLYILSEKTSNPDLFKELGVEDPGGEDSDSTLLTLLDASGNKLVSLIIGNKRSTDALFVRKAGSNETYLVSGQPDVSADLDDWIRKSLLNVANERIMETTIEHPDGETVHLSREKGEENFVLSDIPEGRKSRSQYFTNQPATFLADLTIQNARSRENFTFSGPQVKTTIKTYDGLVATIHSAKIDNDNYASMEFSVDETLLDQGGAEDQKDDTIVIGDQQSDGNGEKPDVRQEAEDLNDKVKNWVFVLPQSRYLLLTKQIEELTDVVENPDGETGAD